MKKLVFLLCLNLFVFICFAQEQLLNVAKQYFLSGDFEKAKATYQQLAEYNPNDRIIQHAYFECLMATKDYKTAEALIKKQIKVNKKSDIYNYDLGKLYLVTNEIKKANKIFEKIIDNLPPSENEFRSLANQFQKDGFIDQAIEVFETARKKDKSNPYLFAEEMALLYDKKGDSDKATQSLLDLYISQPEKGDEVKATFQRMFDKPEKMIAFQKLVTQRISTNEAIMAYPDLLAWLYLQQHDYENAYKQIKKIDEQLNEQGRRILGYARATLREKEYKVSLMAYDEVTSKGKDLPYYKLARVEKLTCGKEQLKYNPHYSQSDVANLSNEYALLIDEFPNLKLTETYREYAELEVKYAHNIEKAIELLAVITNANNVDKTFRGKCKLEMGDYELIRDNQWESTLLYSQVDKEFKQDYLGEEARFRNAKLSYFTGDFVWAQGQLDVLKGSTTELIANDALNLSVLITENNPIVDSNETPLLMFARADLLEFQNKDAQAIAILDSITNDYPKHPLLDNILMERARIASKKQDYSEAAMHLQKIVNNYSDEILADDALFQLAYIYENFFSNKEEAKHYYEKIILNYPGSTFVNEARKNFRRLRGDKADVETPNAF